ncbi:MAG TPA: endolytic transglycosylase MltG [Candidatus Kapabacteria bacterium]|jgi:UPF0755 protein
MKGIPFVNLKEMRRTGLVLILVAAVLGAAYYIFFLKNPKRFENEIVIGIPRGVTLAALSDTLDAYGLLRSRMAFEIAAKTAGALKKLHAGMYRIAPGLSNSEIVRRLTGSEYALILKATFPEGITMYRAASIAHEKLGLDSGIFMRFATDTAFLRSLGVPITVHNAEGYLFPDTYEFLLSADPKDLIVKMIKHWKRIAADSIYAQALVNAPKQHLTLAQVMTLASIVEAEDKVPSEMDTIASVYLNRLKIGMKLDADPTVQYGLHLARPIGHDDLSVPTSYNTYLNAGLPPGPICNPGAASIRAVLHPAQTNYLYFVARRDGSGRDYFSRSLQEQDRNIALSNANADR